jgi:hypothetical protein
MVSRYMTPVETESSSEGDDTRHWWPVEIDTLVGGLGMKFATLDDASSEIHQAQQLSADRCPLSHVWGDPISVTALGNCKVSGMLQV